MSIREIWSADRSSVMVQNAAAGPPYFGVAKRLDLLDDKWHAHSSMYGAPMDLGVYDSAASAIVAIVLEAQNVTERRARNAEIARGMALSAQARRVTGAGRTTVHPEGWLERIVPGAGSGGRRSRKTREATA